MESQGSPERRAAKVLVDNEYLALACSDSKRNWTCALSFTLGRGAVFHFASQPNSLHAELISVNERVSGIVYDSTATMDDVENFQFDGIAQVVPHEEKDLTELFGNTLRSEVDLDAKVKRVLANPGTRYFRVEILNGFVLDQEAWKDAKVDRREKVDVGKVFEIVESSYQ